MRTLFTKTLYDKRWFALGWSLVFVFTIVFTVIFYPSLTQGNTFEELSKTVPGQLKGFIGDEQSFNTIEGYVAEQLYNFRVPLMLMIMALILAQGLTVADEERGTLRTLTSTPLGRSRILWERWLAGVAVFGITALIGIVTAYIGSLIINEALPFDFLLRIGVLSWLFGITAFSIMYTLGAATGSRAVTMITGLTIILGGFILTTFGSSVDWLKNWEILSLMHYANTDSIVKDSLDRLNIWVMALLSSLALLVATVLFRRRDIN
jgi:ABC-2 type transport system permease protein